MKLKKYIVGAIVLAIALFFSNVDVKAEEYTGQIWASEYISNIFVKKVRPDGSGQYKQARFIRKSDDNQFVYCLQPFVEVNNNATYNVAYSDYAVILGMSEEQWKRVSLLAYYGYGYGSHTDAKWYEITQVLIWRTVDTTADIYFTDTLNGNRNDNLFVSEINELNSLVENHSKKPSFTLKNDTMTIGSELVLSDNNGVINNYSVTSSNNLSVSKEGNQLKIKATNIGNATIQLKKISNLYERNPVLYFSTDSQNVVRVGNVDPITMSFNLKIIGGKVTIHKLDRETGENTPSGEASLENATYGIYDVTGNLVTTLKTGLDGTVQSDYLPYVGEYKIREISSSLGYELDSTEYSFFITENQLFPEVTVYEQVIRRPIKIAKFYASSDTGKLEPEENITFEFYNKNNEKVAEVKTDSDGYASLSLPYGKYTGRQKNTSKDHEKVEDFSITVDENSPEVIKLAFSNAPIKARLKVVKVDEETKQVIQRSNIKFKIYDVNSNEYVCQTISYPKAETICEFKTDENGILYTPYELNAGTYLLEEADQVIDGYLWNKTSKEFTIGENSKFIIDDKLGVIFEVEFENKQVKGQIRINKIGEKFVIEDGNFKYNKITLEDVEFEIKANEDIIIGGKLYYKKGDVVDIIKSNSDGIALLDNMPLGKYVLSEKATNSNHVLLDNTIEFELKYEDQYTEKVILELNVENYYKKGTLYFTKTDLVDGTPIENVEIKIFTENDELVYTGVTDSEGKIIITDLPINTKMYIIETRAADNYQLTDEKVFFEILENGEIVKASLTNERVIIEVPDTGLNESYIIELMGCVLIFVGIGGVIYVVKKNTKEK